MKKLMNCYIKLLGNMNVEEPTNQEINYALNLFQIDRDNLHLPIQFSEWECNVEHLIKLIPECDGANNHFVTIASHYYEKEGGFLRREGIHVDGNFCADRKFIYKGWAGIYFDSCGKLVIPFDCKAKVEEGTYVSSDLGGIICVSSFAGCRAWEGEMTLYTDKGQRRTLIRITLDHKYPNILIRNELKNCDFIEKERK